jgi:hypothetical protein
VKRRPGRRKRGTPSPRELPLAEWNFNDCREDELSICVAYEFSRSSELIRDTIARRRAGEDDPLTRAVLFVFPLTLGLWLPESVWWPDIPYLDIREEERQKRAKPFPQSDPKESLASLLDPFVEDHLNSTSGDIIPVYLPRGLTLDTLSRAFKDLILREYPEVITPRTYRKGSGEDQDNLKSLSAWRLAQAGYTATEAIQLSKAHRVDTYNSVRTYRRAVARAEQKITQLEHSLRLLVERASACKW